MAKKRIISKRYLFEQQLKPDFWNWGDKIELFEDYLANKQAIFQEIYDRVLKMFDDEEDGGKIEIALIVHDRDVSYGSKLVEPHVHGYIDLPKKVDMARLAGNLGLDKEHIETPKSKGGRVYTRINSLAYLVHAKDRDKYQYPISDVETFGTIDYKAFIEQHKENFLKYAATKKREKSDENLDLVLAKIQSGELTYVDVMEDDDLAFLFGNNQQKFRERFNFFGERETFLRMKSLERGEYQLTVLYIQGESDVGKSTLAREIAMKVQAKMNEIGLRGDIYSASSSNPFDNYFGEEILLLDDLREYNLSPSDWLKLFDPLNSAKMSARYQNKLVVPRLVIMPVYKQPKTFFGEIQSEDLNQFLRRINFLLDVSFQRGTDKRLYNVSEVVKRRNIDFFERKDGSTVVLNFRYEDMFCSDNKEHFIDKLLTECVYPRILPVIEVEKKENEYE